MKIPGRSHTRVLKILLAAVAMSSTPLIAQPAVDHSQHAVPAPVDHSQHAVPAPETPAVESAAPADARSPHAYSGGYQLGAGLYALEQGHDQLHVVDSHRFGAFIVDQLETVEADGAHATGYDMQAWIRQGFSQLTLKAEGEVAHSRVEESRTELLWGKAIAPYWDTQMGIRHDSGDAPDQSWLAFGIQGLAPYWFEIDATAYLSGSGRTALRLEAEYELLLTQRLILQHSAELNFYGKDDRMRRIGRGLAEAEAGVRLRYEITRQFAPYIGVEWAARYGKSADFSRSAGERVKALQWVAGMRFWF